MNKEQKITTDIKVPNKDLETLKKHFPHYFDKNGNFDFEKFKNYLTEKEINFSTESYGLEWLGKSYARLLASDPATTLLKADETHNNKPENAHAENLLIKGDNLEVLKHLANAYYEKIKMIYIDPPYNTGSDGFVYNDDRKYTVKELQNLIGIDEEKAKRILEFTQSKSNSHSAWLTFMYPRLYIAKQLLREDGVIFVSIDDNEVAQLKLLMDEIFGEENLLDVFYIQVRYENKSLNEKDDFQKLIEQVLVYAKSKYNFVANKPYEEYNIDKFCYEIIEKSAGENIILGNRNVTVFKPGQFQIVKHSKGRIGLLKETWASGSVLEGNTSGKFFEKYISSRKEIDGPGCLYKVEGIGEDGLGYRYFTGPKKDNATKGKFYSGIPLERIEELNSGISRKYKPIVNFHNMSSDFGNIRHEGGVDFRSGKKPTKMIRLFLEIVGDKKCLILDFFAGSGTTGDAVMQLNAEDGGNRKFILVQLPEAIDPKKNKTAYDFVKNELKAEPTIFEITKERLLRAAKKIKEETIHKKIAEKEKQIKDLESQLDLENKEEQIAQLKKEIQTLQNQDLGFKIFETMPIWEDYDFEAETFDSSQTLFDTGKLTEDDVKALLITWKTYDGMALTQELECVDLGGYTAYYGSGKLYLMHKGFTTDCLKAILEKIDTDKHFEPKTIIAFGYHFESARLREIAENVKTYNNKKNTDIDFIIRY